MILSLAYQAAQNLPGVATFLDSMTMKKHNDQLIDLHSLSLEELFHK